MKRWRIALGCALLAFVAGRCLVPMDETDLFYNLRLGEIILETLRVPRTNLLSFTYPDHPDPNLAWVFQIVLALTHRAGGVAATVVLKTAFVLATFALLYTVALRRGAHPAAAALALALGAWAAEPRFVERPHLVTFLGLAALLLALERAEAGRPRLLWAMIPLGLLWANGNSCFFLAPGVLSLYAAGALVDGARPAARRAALVALALCPLAFATPSGSGVLGYVANHFRMPSLRPLQEYRTAEWPVDGPFFFLAAAAVLLLVRTDRRGPVPLAAIGPGGVTRQLLPLAALGLLGSQRIRFVAEFALLGGPFVAARTTGLARLGALRIEAASAAWSARAARAARALPAVAVLALVALTLGPRLHAAGTGGRFAPGLGIEPGLVPLEAVAWIDGHGLRDRMYNDLEVGSYLAWQGWPRARVFQDPRINAYPAEMHATLRRMDLSRAEWEALLGRAGVEAALITFPGLNPRAALFDPARWALVYRSGEALVLVRRDSGRPGFAALAATDEIPLTFRFDRATGVEPIPLDRPPPGSPVRACEWQRRLGDLHVARRDPDRAWTSYRAALAEGADCLDPPARDPTRVAAGALALRFGEPARAAALLEGIADPAARINRSFALLQLDRPLEALAEVDAALAARPHDPEARFGRALALERLGRRPEAAAALRAFLHTWPSHFAARQAAQLLDRLQRAPP